MKTYVHQLYKQVFIADLFILLTEWNNPNIQKHVSGKQTDICIR